MFLVAVFALMDEYWFFYMFWISQPSGLLDCAKEFGVACHTHDWAPPLKLISNYHRFLLMFTGAHSFIHGLGSNITQKASLINS